MSDLKKYLNINLKDEEFKKEWDKLELKYTFIKLFLRFKMKIVYIFNKTLKGA